ncbi:MAG: hypothetical protein AAB675_01660 [Patescibacteria group bacterium]
MSQEADRRIPIIGILETSQRISPEPTLAERIILAHKGRVLFQKAIGVAETTRIDEAINALLEVAGNMTEVSISPESVLEPMIRAKDKLPNERRYQDSASISLANVYGMLGDFDEMRGLLPRPESDDSLWATSAYIYAGETLISQGENPTQILEEAMDRISKNIPRDGNNFFLKVIQYGRIARVLHKANLNPGIAFEKAEEEIRKAEGIRQWGTSDNSVQKQLAEAYISCGYLDDAVRLINQFDLESGSASDKNIPWKIRMDYKYREIRETLGKVFDEQINLGNIEGAAKTAWAMSSKIAYAQALAAKAVKEADEGINPQPTIDKISEIPEIYDDEFYEKIYPSIFIAMKKSGKLGENSGIMLDTRNAFSELEDDQKAEILFAISDAVEDVGLVGEHGYVEAFNAIDRFHEDYDEIDDFFGTSYELYEDGIKRLAKKGYFDLAISYFEKKFGDKDYSQVKSGIMSFIAREMVEQGLSKEEIESLTPEQVLEIRKDLSTHEAVSYFDLQTTS